VWDGQGNVVVSLKKKKKTNYLLPLLNLIPLPHSTSFIFPHEFASPRPCATPSHSIHAVEGGRGWNSMDYRREKAHTRADPWHGLLDYNLS
jgi:hypothetical protein